MAIQNFSTSMFHTFIKSGMTIAGLLGEVHRRGSKPFVMYDRSRGASALVIPKAVAQWVDILGLDDGESVVDSGLFDMLHHSQLTVRRSQPAGRVAKLALDTHAGLVIATTDSGAPSGLFVPSFVMKHLARSLPIRKGPSELKARVAGMTSLNDLGPVLQAIDNTVSSFHSESINLIFAKPIVCQGGPHTVPKCPCRAHPNAVCGPLQVRP